MTWFPNVSRSATVKYEDGPFLHEFFLHQHPEAKCSASITGVFNDDNGHPCRPFPQISHTPRVFQLQCLQFVHVLTQSLAQTLAPGDRDHMSYSPSKTQTAV